MNDLISFGLPTYNRADLLDEALDYYFNVLHLDEYELHISDNGSTDSTEKVVNKWMSNHTNIRYSRQKENIAADNNFLFLQNECRSKYFMLLGDGVRLNTIEFYHILDIVKTEKYDAIMFDYCNRSKISSREYRDKEKALEDLGWYVTQLSSYILKKEIIDKTSDMFVKYNGSEFNYWSRMWIYFALKGETSLYWFGEDCMHFSNIPKLNTWNSRTIKIWVCEFVSSCMSLPSSYSLSSKINCLKEASKYYLFSNSWIFPLIIKGLFTPSQMIEYKENMKLILPHSWYFYYGISKLPKSALSAYLLWVEFSKKVRYHLKKFIR